jgi:hypothetical protein
VEGSSLMRYVLHLAKEEATYAQVRPPAGGAEAEGVVLHRQIQQQRDIAFALTALVQMLLLSQGEQAWGDAGLGEGLALESALGKQEGVADVQTLRGQLALSQGDLSTASALLEASVQLYREVGAAHHLAEALAQLARVEAARGQWAPWRFSSCSGCARRSPLRVPQRERPLSVGHLKPSSLLSSPERGSLMAHSHRTCSS